MITDVTLTQTGRAIIMDAKYYKDALQTHHNARTVHSANLYQLMAYLRAEAASTARDHRVDGILLYPAGSQSLDLRYEIDGFSVRIYTLDLSQHWSAIEKDLLRLIHAQG
jgi:5-methylcytosine-specific restriction enzyme subunit McrC